MEEAKKDVVLTKKDVARTRNTDELCHAFWSILDLEEEHRTMCVVSGVLYFGKNADEHISPPDI